jgi:hypothetical protein
MVCSLGAPARWPAQPVRSQPEQFNNRVIEIDPADNIVRQL